MPVSRLLASFLIVIFLSIGSSIPDRYRASVLHLRDSVTSLTALPDTTLIREGDIILRKGGNIVSDLIVTVFPHSDDMSHCGLIIYTKNGLAVVHTISGTVSSQDGLRASSVEEFIAGADNGKYKIVRPRFSYDLRKAVREAIILLNRRIAFDNSFDMTDDSKLYCSEFIRKVLIDASAKDIFIYKLLGANRVIDMASFSDLDNFAIIVRSAEASR